MSSPRIAAAFVPPVQITTCASVAGVQRKIAPDRKHPMAILNLKPLSEASQACVDMLEETLEQARSGSIETIAVIACFKTGYATAMSGSNAAQLNMGCDSLKRKILNAVESGGSIIRAS